MNILTDWVTWWRSLGFDISASTAALDISTQGCAKPPFLTKREGKRRASSAGAVSNDLPPPLPPGKACKQLPSTHIVIDLCDDDGLPNADSAEQDFARQFQRSFDEVQVVGEKCATPPPPASHGTAASSDCGSSSTAGDAEIDTSNDEDFAARLQAEVDREIQQENERRAQGQLQDERIARALQALPSIPSTRNTHTPHTRAPALALVRARLAGTP